MVEFFYFSGSSSSSQACSDQDTGCMVSLTKAVGQTAWNRMCCMNALCLDTDVATGDIGVWNQRYCGRLRGFAPETSSVFITDTCVCSPPSKM